MINIELYNKKCAQFLGWERFIAKSAYHFQDGSFCNWHDDPDPVWIENPTSEFRKYLILSNPEEVGLDWDFRLFKDYHYESLLKFHSDWNWIMWIIDKIESISGRDLGYNIEIIKLPFIDNEYICQIKNKESVILVSKRGSDRINVVIDALDHFLNYYKNV